MRRLFNFCTVSRTSLLLILVSICALEGSIIQKQHKAKLVRVLRASEIEKTRLADGTKFERFTEKGEIPELPIEEEEADDLNDPRIGHLGKDGGIVVPVDEKGNVLEGYRYLLNPITVDLDFEENDVKSGPAGDSHSLPGSQNEGTEKDYKPYPNNQDLAPKQEFLPGEQETVGDEYDDVASEPREPLPNVPDLPKLDYSDSGENDEDLKADGDNGEDEGQASEEAAPRREEVIYPIQNIEIPISQDDVDEASKTMDEVEKETEIRRDEESGGRGVDIPLKPEESGSKVSEFEEEESGGRGVDIPKNGLPEGSENADGEQPDKFGPDGSIIDSSEELTDADLENLAKDLGKEVYGNVMNKAKEFGWKDSELDSESEASESDSMDPNSISAQAEIPPNSDGSRVVEAIENDGVVLPDQEELTDEELARIEAERVKPAEPVAPKVPASKPNVRGGRIGSGVQPDSATQHNVLMQFLLVSFVFLAL